MSSYPLFRAEISQLGINYSSLLEPSIRAFAGKRTNVKDIDSVLKTYFWSTFPEECKNALKSSDPAWQNYILDYDQIVNDAMRKSRPLHAKGVQVIDSLVQSLSKMKDSQKEIVLFRGVANSSTFSMEEKNIRDLIIDRGFSSKSHNLAAAARFTDGKCCMFAFRYPPGHKFIAFHPAIIKNFLLKEIALKELEIMTYPGEIFTISDTFLLSFEHKERDGEEKYEKLKVFVLDYVGNFYQEQRSSVSEAKSPHSAISAGEILQIVNTLYDENFDKFMREKVINLNNIMKKAPLDNYVISDEREYFPGEYKKPLAIFEKLVERLIETLVRIVYFHPECHIFVLRGVDRFILDYANSLRDKNILIKYKDKGGMEIETSRLVPATLRIILQENRLLSLYQRILMENGEEVFEELQFPSWEGPLM